MNSQEENTRPPIKSIGPVDDEPDQDAPGKTSRRRTRELALSCCFEIEVGRLKIEPVLKHTVESQDVDPNAEKFLVAAVETVEKYRESIDSVVGELAIGWKLDRIARVDLCILRLAISELLIGFEDPRPPDAVVINEAVVLAKKFSTEDSGKFVNGILASVAKEKDKYAEKLRQP